MVGSSGFQLKRDGPQTYESCWVCAQMHRAAEELIESAGVARGDRVLDVGCGTGVVARVAALRSGDAANITGADVSASMLKAAAHFAGQVGLAGISWLECDAAAIPVPDKSFDVVCCQQGLQFMPDQAAAMTEMARVLKPGGKLALSVWKTRSPLGAAFTKVLDRHFGAGSTAPWEMVYSLGDRKRLHELAAEAGLRDTHVTFDVKFARHPDSRAFVSGALAGSPLADTMADLPEAEQAMLIDRIVSELADYHDDDGLAVPAQCLTLTARR